MNWKNGELPETLNDSMFAADTGYIMGPYFENNSFRLAKLVKIDYLPDSVKARHILLPVNQNNFTQMITMADSLIELLENGADFARLAKDNSTDGSAQEGGDLGWFSEGQMVKPFNDSCFYGKKGDIKKVLSQHGIHIVEITAQARDVKKIKVGVIVHEVEPSDDTDQLYYSRASEFAGKHSSNKTFSQGLQEINKVATEQTVSPMDKTLPGLDNPRLLIKWAFEASEKDISKIYKFGNKYTLATLEKVKHEGYVPMQDVQAEVEVQTLKKKKAERLSDQMTAEMANAKTLDEIAAALNTTVLSASRISFQSRTFGSTGYEPLISAIACNMAPNNISPPIEGNNGVYVVEVIQVNEAQIPEGTNLNMDRSYIERNKASRANIATFETLKEMADIEDNRIKFY
jgi:peptidyl-prolyl cis-trans isomerase D